MDKDEIDRRLEEVLGPLPTRSRVTSHSLDDPLASRTHVRVLRVLVDLGDEINLTARDVARRANASHGRVLEVLRQLSSLAMVRTH